MRFLIAPDSFKESLTAAQAAEAIRAGLAAVLPDAEFDLVPLADGGEGTAECLRTAWQGRWQRCTVTGPLGTPVQAEYAVAGAYAVIESAEACGIMLAPPEARDPMIATTYGVGEMIRIAIENGCKNLIITLGGSMTNDGGLGALQALGAKLTNAAGNPIARGGKGLDELAGIDLTPCKPLLKGVHITILYDVTSHLLGAHGATRVFGRQKGATDAQIELLEAAMTRYAKLLHIVTGTDWGAKPGAGAAGGLGAALMALSGMAQVEFRCGADYIMDAARLPQRMQDCDLVIVGEGAIDAQSLAGKLPIRVAHLAKQLNLPVVAFAGLVQGSGATFRQYGIDEVYCILRRVSSLEEALRNARENLTAAAETFAGTLMLSQTLMQKVRTE